MRILFTIPHFVRPNPSGFYGSLRTSVEMRARYVAECLASIHRTFGNVQALLKRGYPLANGCCQADVTIVVCTSGNNHLLDCIPKELYTHYDAPGDPSLLGYECHSVLRDGLGQYDYYCYLEDDLQLLDSLFFWKLDWFRTFAGEHRLLQPNRYEVTAAYPRERLFIDGPLAQQEIGNKFQLPITQKQLVASHLGHDLIFQRVNNPHSGCFFLTESQMRHWSKQSWFLDRSKEFIGPLESAATLGLMRTFEIFKPARENASFLELRHMDNRYLGVRVAIEGKG